MELRDYQQQMIARWEELEELGSPATILQLPTGGGKTVIASEIIRKAIKEKGQRVYFVVHRKELVDQSVNMFKPLIDCGRIASGYEREYDKSLQVCMVQTLARRLFTKGRFKVEAPDLIIWDECHHVAATSWKRIYEWFSNAKHIGLTATPIRLDGKGLDKFFSNMIFGPTIKELVKGGHLSKNRCYAPSKADLRAIRTMAGDYNNKDLNKWAMSDEGRKLIGITTKEYFEKMPGGRAVVFASSLDHSRFIVARFIGEGVVAAHLDGKTDKKTREETINKFRNGEIQVISNVGLFDEGFDVPALDGIFMLRPTQSLCRYLQMCGRALRPYPGKKYAYVIDQVGNADRHGLPEADRDWEITEDKIIETNEAPVKKCPKCHCLVAIAVKICPSCGYDFGKDKGIPQETKKELVLLNAEYVDNTLDRLTKIARDRGWSESWAWNKAAEAAAEMRGLMPLEAALIAWSKRSK